jgi:hypothetical protein
LPGIFGADVVESEQKRLANVGEPLRQIPAGVTHSANMADPENWVNPLRGYAYDSFNPDVLSTATVKNGNVVFESGATYKILVFTEKLKMNPNYQYISYQTVKKLLDLIKAGAKVIVGDKPLYQSGIKQVSHAEFNKVVEGIWDKNTAPNFIKKIGLGTAIKAPYYGDNFDKIGVKKDIEIYKIVPIEDAGLERANNVTYTHRVNGQKEIYFISNQENKERDLYFSFRVVNKIPQVYDAVSDKLTDIKSWSNFKGTTGFSYKLAPNQSLFFLFENETSDTQLNKGNNWLGFRTIQDISKSWQAKFDTAYAGPSESVTFNDLADWTTSTDSLVKYYSGTAVYTRNFTFNGDLKAKTWIDLGEFSSIAEVKINGINCGTLWTAPYRLDISNAIKNGENQITIEVTNTWANRLIGDSKLPENKRITKTTAPFRLEGKPLNPAGLLGPVTIQREEK